MTIFVDDAGQHIAGPLEDRHPRRGVVFRHRHHLFDHLQVDRRNRSARSRASRETQRLQRHSAGLQRRLEGFTLRGLDASLAQLDVMIDIAGAGDDLQMRKMLFTLATSSRLTCGSSMALISTSAFSAPADSSRSTGWHRRRKPSYQICAGIDMVGS
jgi:hypothetical protein